MLEPNDLTILAGVGGPPPPHGPPRTRHCAVQEVHPGTLCEEEGDDDDDEEEEEEEEEEPNDPEVDNEDNAALSELEEAPPDREPLREW